MARTFTPPAPLTRPSDKYEYIETGTDTTAAQAVDPLRLSPAERIKLAYEARRDKFGGFHLGAALAGWLIATSITAIVTALLTVTGLALAYTSLNNLQNSSVLGIDPSAGTIGFAGGALLVGLLAGAYFAGGYVAGRMSRFNGTKQGIGVWTIGMMIVAATAGAVTLFGAQYNILGQQSLPRIPVSEGALTPAGFVVLIMLACTTLIAAAIGGKLGERYHRRIDKTID